MNDPGVQGGASKRGLDPNTALKPIFLWCQHEGKHAYPKLLYELINDTNCNSQLGFVACAFPHWL